MRLPLQPVLLPEAADMITAALTGITYAVAYLVIPIVQWKPTTAPRSSCRLDGMDQQEHARWAVTHLTRAYTELKTGQQLSDEELIAVFGDGDLVSYDLSIPVAIAGPEDIHAMAATVAEQVAGQAREQFLPRLGTLLFVAANLALIVEEMNPGVDAGAAIQELALRIAAAQGE